MNIQFDLIRDNIFENRTLQPKTDKFEVFESESILNV